MAFFLMGTLNNLTFVVNVAGASELLPGQAFSSTSSTPRRSCSREGDGTALVALVPRTAQRSSQLFLLCDEPCAVSSGLQPAASIQLVGVALSNIGGGLGEACTHVGILAASLRPSKFAFPAWSSGTGAAGVLGYLIRTGGVPQLGIAW